MSHRGRSGDSPRVTRDAQTAGPSFRDCPLLCRAVNTGWVLLAVGLALRDGLPTAAQAGPLLGALGALLALVVLDVEIGRRAEGGRLVGQRPHKGLTAWPFAAAIVSPCAVAVLVVVPVYAYARARGMRIQLWKWVGSGAIGVVSGATADLALGGTSLAWVLLAAAAFLLVNAAGFWGAALTGDPADEGWLRAQLTSRAYYANELAVLCQGAVVATLYLASPSLVLLAAPSFAVLQRALMHAPLRDRADRDAKTGLLNHGAWTTAAERELALPHPVGLLLVDLDHFKRVNDSFGHLVGDAALAATARALEAAVRPVDVVGRFGGEEFCVLLPDVRLPESAAVAERVRAAVAAVRLPECPDLRLSASVGVHVADRPSTSSLSCLLTAADRALLVAKTGGRDRVVGPQHVPVQRGRTRSEPSGPVRPVSDVSGPAPSSRPK